MTRHRVIALLTAVLCCLILVGVTLAQGSTSYRLTWSVVASGGDSTSRSANYILGGTAGQGAPGEAVSASYKLGSGFWHGVPMQYDIYLPIVMRDSS